MLGVVWVWEFVLDNRCACLLESLECTELCACWLGLCGQCVLLAEEFISGHNGNGQKGQSNITGGGCAFACWIGDRYQGVVL